MNDSHRPRPNSVSVRIPFVKIVIKSDTILGLLVTAGLALALLAVAVFVAVSLGLDTGRNNLAQEIALSVEPVTADLKKISDLVNSEVTWTMTGTSRSRNTELLELLRPPEENLVALRSLDAIPSKEGERLAEDDPAYFGQMLSLSALGLVDREPDSAFFITPLGRGILETTQQPAGSCSSLLPGEPQRTSDWAAIVADLRPPRELLASGTASGDFASSPCHLYSFQVPEGRNYEIQTSGRENALPADTVLRLFRSDDLELIDVDDDGGDGVYSRLRQGLVADTEYYLLVSSFGLLETGSYGLDIAPLVPDAADFVQPPSRAGSLGVNVGPVVGRIESAVGDAWYSFTARSDGTHVVETLPASDTSQPVDTLVRLYEQVEGSLLLIGEDDDGQGDDSLYSLLRENLKRDQLYFLQVSSFWGEAGDFGVQVRRQGDV